MGVGVGGGGLFLSLGFRELLQYPRLVIGYVHEGGLRWLCMVVCFRRRSITLILESVPGVPALCGGSITEADRPPHFFATTQVPNAIF